MTLPRRLIVNPAEPGWYHCVSRCVRRAFLCGDGKDHRKDWIVDRLKLLSQCFSIEIAAYAVMSNHLHVVVRFDPHGSDGLLPHDIARRWLTVYARKHDDAGNPIAPSDKEIEEAAKDWSWIATRRRRLGDLGWFMKALKEPIAGRANREDQVTGHFWEGRFHSTALLDHAAVIACMAYVDLNPIRACMARTPETSAHTSVQDRIHARQYFHAQHGLAQAAPERARSLFTNLAPDAKPQHQEDGLWLWNLHRPNPECWQDVMNPDTYLALVDNTGRILRERKRGRIAPDLIEQLQRLKLDSATWIETMKQGRQMRGTGLGQVTSRAVEAKRRGVGWVVNQCALFAKTDEEIEAA
jgi:REP element-mobilizing transposase RayT